MNKRKFSPLPVQMQRFFLASGGPFETFPPKQVVAGKKVRRPAFVMCPQPGGAKQRRSLRLD